METGRAASIAARPRADVPRSRSVPRRCPTPVRAASPARRVGTVNADEDGLALLRKVEADLKALADAEAKALETLQKLEEDRKQAFGAYFSRSRPTAQPAPHTCGRDPVCHLV